jgi:hypothetical protein
MSEMSNEAIARLRQLAVEFVRSDRLADVPALLTGIGAIELMGAFSGSNGAAGTPDVIRLPDTPSQDSHHDEHSSQGEHQPEHQPVDF